MLSATSGESVLEGSTAAEDSCLVECLVNFVCDRMIKTKITSIPMPCTGDWRMFRRDLQVPTRSRIKDFTFELLSKNTADPSSALPEHDLCHEPLNKFNITRHKRRRR
jgi:hypothetical protein